MNEPKINFKIVLKSDLSELVRVRSIIEQKLKLIEIIERNRIVLAIDEVISNIIEHGYKHDPNNIIEIQIEFIYQEKITIIINDNAPHFNMLKIPNPNLTEHSKEGKPRGLGLFLVRTIFDEIEYHEKKPKGNINILIKKLN